MSRNTEELAIVVRAADQASETLRYIERVHGDIERAFRVAGIDADPMTRFKAGLPMRPRSIPAITPARPCLECEWMERQK